MPGNPPGRPGGEHDEPLLDMIFERRPIPPGAPREIHDLARMLAAAAGPAEYRELAGEAAALAAFTRQFSSLGASPAARRPARRWLSGRPSRGKLPLAAALVVAAGLGSTAAAYADVLPGPIQHFAHKTIGAPDGPGPGTRHEPAVGLARPGKRRQPDPSALPKPRPRNTPATRDSASSPTRPSESPRHHAAPTSAGCTPVPVPTHGAAKPGSTGSTPGSGPTPWPIPSPAKPGCRAPTARAATVRAATPHPSL